MRTFQGARYRLKVGSRCFKTPCQIGMKGAETERRIVTDIFYEPMSEDRVMVEVADSDQTEYIIAEVEYKGHEQDQEGCYNLCLEIAHELGYALVGEVE